MNRKSALSLSAASALALVAGTIAIAPGTSAATAEHAATNVAKPKPTVSIKASTTELVLGDKVKIKGKVTPRPKGEVTTALQKKIVGKKKWKTQDTGTLNKRGKYKFKDKPTTAQSRYYRVVVDVGGKAGKVRSPKLLVGVYRWQDLASIEPRDYTYFNRNTEAKIDTVSYPKSLVGSIYGHTGFIDYNIARKCIVLKARFGLGDGSDSAATAVVDVLTDNTNVYSRSFALTESEPRTLSLRGVFRLKFAFTATNPDTDPIWDDTGAQAVVASPKVLCSD